MPIQPEPILRGAVRWLERVPTSGVARTRSLLVTNPRLADLTPTQYEIALQWLERSGLLGMPNSGAPASVRVYEHAVTEAEWFPDTDFQVRNPDELPSDALQAAAATALGEGEAFQHLIATWAKVDTEIRERVGAVGEEQLADLLRNCLDAEIQHVSQWSDGLGYDIAVVTRALPVHLEVKSTTRQRRLTIFLSRNEFEVMLRDPNWVLAALTLSDEMEILAIRTVCRSFLANAAPRDERSDGQWQSCRFDVPPEATLRGLPAVRSLARPHALRALGLDR